MKYPDFTNAKVGDKVWSPFYGDGNIINIDFDHNYCIQVKLKIGIVSFTVNGMILNDHNFPQLFWKEFDIEVPEDALTPPERLVERWIVFFESLRDKSINISGCGIRPNLYKTEEEAKASMEGTGYIGPFKVLIPERLCKEKTDGE